MPTLTRSRPPRYRPSCIRCGGTPDLDIDGHLACYPCAPMVQLYHPTYRRSPAR